MNVQDGANLTSNNFIVLGNKVGSSGSINANGTNTNAKTDTMYVGNQGMGYLDINNQANVNITNNLVVSNNSSNESNVVNVNDAGSKLTAKNIAIGNDGNSKNSMSQDLKVVSREPVYGYES